jgi:hypothetical protein
LAEENEILEGWNKEVEKENEELTKGLLEYEKKMKEK